MIPVFERDMGKEEITAVAGAIGSGEITGSLSKAIPPFEEAFAVYCGGKYGGAVTSGTTALQLAIAALNLSAGEFVKGLFALLDQFQVVHRCWPASRQFPSSA
jgi:Predicted pyridoxal phosphate-dependent enzyme apparently involved in regulation of cell wall biogenesis